jgi:predicted nucleic acid-binding protein
MNAKPFLDTNVLVYAFATGDPRNQDAEDLIAAGGIISVQVMNEFVNVSRHKARRSWSEIEQSLAVLAKLLDPPLPMTMTLHAAALDIARRWRFKFYDSLIIAAALQAGCDGLYTEDLQHGRKIGGLTISNPFLP